MQLEYSIFPTSVLKFLSRALKKRALLTLMIKLYNLRRDYAKKPRVFPISFQISSHVP
jgi:hypothetical protein